MTDKEDFATLLGEFEKAQTAGATRNPRVGDKVWGTIVSIKGGSLFIDLGAKTEGVVDVEEFSDAEGNLTVGLGDTVESIITGEDEESGTLLLGTRHARSLHGSEGLQRAFEQRLPVEGHVTGTTKGGIEVEISGVRAFCPASQVSNRYVEDMESLVGQRLAFRITKFEGGRHTNLVVSRRVLLEEEERVRASETRARLEVGAVLKGRVTALKEFGAFVDLGGIQGMVHKSELAFGHVRHPEDLLTVGQQIEVSVLRIEKSNNPRQPEKIALSMRALERDPWLEASQKFPVGTQVLGTISRIQPFGAFVELAPGVDALLHISELGAGRRVTHPEEVVKVGERVRATVLAVDTEKRRIALSLDPARQSGDMPTAEIASTYGRPKQSLGTFGDLLKESMNKKK